MKKKSDCYDLHCHSTHSDGEKTPFELINLAKEQGLKGMSITDHDTVSCYDDDLFAYSAKRGIDLITGVELSSFYMHGKHFTPIHILGYGVDPNNSELLKFCESHKERRKKRFFAIVEKLNLGGYRILKDHINLDKIGNVGRPHIAHALVKLGHAKDVSDAFNRFLGEKAPFYIPSKLPTIQETIEVIKKSGGKAFLAHPVLIKSRKVLRKIIEEHNFDGMECFYGNFPQSKLKYLFDMAEKENLLISGGSDYHGSSRSYIYLGISFVEEQLVKEIVSI